MGQNQVLKMTAKLMNNICRCTGGTEIDGEVKICPVRNQCLRYLERETFRFRGLLYQYPVMIEAFAIKDSGCSNLITREDWNHAN